MMTDKRIKHKGVILSDKEVNQILNKQDKRITELEKKQNKVQKVLTDYCNCYAQMAVDLRHDKYGNSVCHDVTEVIMEIADRLNQHYKQIIDLEELLDGDER